MPLSKSQIVEIQEAAKFNYLKRLRDQKEKSELKQKVAEQVAKATEIKPVAAVDLKSEKKGK